MSKKERKVFLLGAGAAIPWNGPTTKCLTALVCQTGFKNSTGQYITQAVFDHLEQKCEILQAEINFETILNVIEDFIDFWSHTERRNINGLSFFISKSDVLWDNYLNYSLKCDPASKTYSIEIPGASEYINASLQWISKDIPPQKKFLQVLFSDILDIIANRVFDYSNNATLGGSGTDEMTKLAVHHFKNLRDSLLRIYTLNYDRIIQSILDQAGIHFFEGTTDEGGYIAEKLNLGIRHFSPPNFLRHVNYNCVYHLHGSAFWEVIPEDSNRLPYYSFVLKHHFSFPSAQGHGTAEVEMEKGRKTQISNIVSGYRKTIRIGLSPFRQMFSAFDRDCLVGDEMIIIGYSFGDEHINDIINKARHSNPSLKIEIIDPAIDIKGFFIDIVSKWVWFDKLVEPDKPSEDVYIFKDYNLTLYKMFFQDYLAYKVET